MMIKTFRVWLAGLCFVLLGAMGGPALAGPSEQEAKLVGTWYGEFAPQPGMPLQRFLTTRRADGTFTLVARMYEAGKAPSELVNVGLWGVSNGLYFTVTTEVNGTRANTKSPETISSFLVRDLQADAFTYQHILSGNLLRVSRVSANTTLP